MKWRKSSRSGPNGGNCVELAVIGGWAAVRDSKNPQGPHQEYSQPAWRRFLDEVRHGTYDI